MSFVRTLLLLAVAAGLGAWLWFVEVPKLEQEAKADLLLDFETADARKLRLAYPDGDRVELVKENDAWKLTEPVAYKADDKVVENFLTTIKDTKIARRMPKTEAGELATYGLDAENGAQGRLELTLAGEKVLPAVVLGIATPVGYEAFARREGDDEVFVIPLLLQSSARKTPDELRAKSMFEGVDSTGIQQVTIEKPGEKIELVRKGEAAWAMTSPVADAADVESVRSMLDSIATIDAIGFYDGAGVDRAAFGLEAEATRFRAVRDDDTAVAFAVGKEAVEPPAGNYFERASDRQVVKVPDWVAKKFAPSAAELRDRRLLTCRIDDIRSMTFTMAGDTFTLAREAVGKPWTINPPIENQVVNQRIVDNAVEGLVQARADELVGDAKAATDLAQYGLDAPVARLVIDTADGRCASLSASPAPVPAPAADGRPPLPSFFVKDDARSAVLRASQHEYSRIAMKRPAFVEAAKKAAGAASAAGDASGGEGAASAPAGQP